MVGKYNGTIMSTAPQIAAHHPFGPWGGGWGGVDWLGRLVPHEDF
jgi:hypothetical protein